MFVGSSISFDADVFDTEAGSDMEIYRDFDVNDGSITDRNKTILTQLTVRWDFDIETDVNENGDPADDWEEPTPGSSVRAINTWDATGFYTILIEVCDGMNQCDTLTEDIEIVPEPDGPPSLSDFSADEWKSWLADAGSELATFIALIVVALILGWLVMREPSALEEEAKEAAETYTDIELVEAQGGLLGMDHHLPPPAPKILSKDERRNDESGYVRPLRRR